MLAGAGTPTPPPLPALVDADLLDQVPPDLVELLRVLPRADVYLQDEIQFVFHPTLTRLWCRKGRRGQRLVCAPGANAKGYGFGIVDWVEGWFDGRLAAGRTAAQFCEQVRAAVERARQRNRVAIVLADNLRPHTAAGSKLVRAMREELQGQWYLVSPPAYAPDANRIEWLWRISRRAVPHNHQRETWEAVVADIRQHFHDLAERADEVLRHIGSACARDAQPPPAEVLAACFLWKHLGH